MHVRFFQAVENDMGIGEARGRMQLKKTGRTTTDFALNTAAPMPAPPVQYLVQNIACAYATLSPFTAVLFLGLGPAVWCRSLSFGDRAWKGDPPGPCPDPRVISILTNLVPAHTRVDLLMGAPSTDGSGHRDGWRRETRDSSLPDRPRGRRTGGKEEGREQGGKGPRGAAGRGGHAGGTERAAEGESGRKDRTSGRSGKKRRGRGGGAR